MRITNSMMTNQFLTESNEALNRVAKYQSQVDSTKRLNSIADDPQGTLLAMRARNKLTNLDLYKSNISTATSYLKEAESGTSALNEIIQSAYDDIISAQSSKTPDDLKILSEHIKNLQDEVLSISNSSLGTSYIFGGYNYTGKLGGSGKQPPFTVDSVTGDLKYNGINLSQFSWKAEFDKKTSDMSALRDSIGVFSTAFAASTNDEYAKVQAQSAADALNSLVSSAKAAMEDAREFGVDPSTSPSYMAFESFYNDISGIAEALNNEVSKELTGANPFSIALTQPILNQAALYLAGSPAPMDTVIVNLSGDLDVSAALPALTDETANKTTLQIGSSQTVDMTLTGLDLLGTGAENLYHILGKAVKMLGSGAGSDELSGMLTSLQNAQSGVLTLSTRIGATQNRMTLISNRYDSSTLNYTSMRSSVEDVDMAEAIIHLTEAQSVYNAALAGGAEILKTSLIDFLR